MRRVLVGHGNMLGVWSVAANNRQEKYGVVLSGARLRFFCLGFAKFVPFTTNKTIMWMQIVIFNLVELIGLLSVR